MKKITFLLFAFFSIWQINAQVSSYSFSQSAGTYTEITGGTVLGTATTTTSFDSTNWAIPTGTIPFNFNFNGSNFTGCVVNSNGYLTFGAVSPDTFTSSPLSGTLGYSGAISAWGGDLCSVFISGLITGETRYEVVGTAPNREFVVQFKNWRPTYSSSATTVPFINFQIRLQETTNKINVVYGATGSAIGTPTTAGTRQIGLRGGTNADFNNRLNATTLNFNSSTAGTANNNSQAYSYVVGSTQGLPTNGLTYTWTAPTCLAPSGLSTTVLTTTSATVSWNAVPTASSGYEYVFSTTNTAPTVAGTVNAGTNVSLSSLSPNTTYYFWVRSNCGAGDFSSWATFSFYTGYCVPSSTGSATYFNNFSTSGGLTNITNNASGFTTGGYQDNYSTSNVTSFATGSVNYSYSIVGGTTGVAIWIDWNNNLVFETSERAYTSNTYLADGTYTGSIAVPSGQALGSYRMRIRTDWNSTNPDPCAVSFNRTEAEDYKFTVTTPPADAMDFNNIQWITDGTNGSNSSLVVPANTPLTAFAEGYEAGVTEAAGAGTGVEAWIGYSSTNTDPSTWPANAWFAATYVDNQGNNDNFSRALTLPVGTNYVASRWRLNSALFTYGGFNGTWNGASNYSIQVIVTPLANDDCTGAFPLTVGSVFATNAVVTINAGATASQIATPSIPAPGCSSYAGGDVWHSVVVPASGNVTIETNNSTGSLITDTGLAVYSGACGSLALVLCDDDASSDGNFSLINVVGRTPGEVLYVRSFEYGNDAFGNYRISAYDCPSNTAAPSGDAVQTFCNSATISSLVAIGTTIKWYAAATGGTALVGTTPLVSGTTYYASQTLTCESFARLAVTPSINPLTAPTFAPIGTLCSGTTAPALETSSTNLITGIWSPESINTAATGTVTYTFTPTAGQCASVTTLDVTVNPTPAAPTGNVSQTYCDGTVASLQAAGSSIQWYAAATGGSPLATSTTLATATTYYASQTVNGCESNDRLAVTVTVLCYCTPTYTNGVTDGDLISNVAILGTTLANNTGTTPSGPSYTFFTGQPNYTATLQAGSTYTVSASVGTFGGQNIAVWIDYNDNFIFEASEKVGFTTTSINGNGTATFSISLSCSPPLGLHRMRVRDVWNTTGSAIDPCTNYGYGETEDYNVTISAAVACPQPSALAVNTITSNSANLTWNVGCIETLWDLHLTTAGGGAPTGAPSNPNATSPFAASGLTPATAYEFYVRADCQANGVSLWTGPFIFTTNSLPPLNDECSGAYTVTVNPDLSCASVTAGTINAATASTVDATACFGTENDDVWFTFVATATTHQISLNNVLGSTTDLYHSVWTGVCSGLTLVPNTCSDPNTSTPSGLVIGQTYYIRVYSWGATSQTSTFNVCVGTLPPPPANDECSGAYVVTVNPDLSCTSVTAGTISSATASTVDATACFGTENDDVWFTFVATATTHQISLNNVLGTTTDLYHSVWTGGCSSLTLVPNTCSDPNTSTPSGLVIGQTYYIRVYSYGGTSQITTFNVCVGTLPPPPANDDCSGAIALTSGGVFADYAVVGTNASATNSNPPAPGCAAFSGADVWYSVTIPASGTLTVETGTGTLLDTGMAVYSGSCSNLALVLCNDDNPAGGAYSIISLTRTPGEVLYVNVWDFAGGDIGTFQISAYDASLFNGSFDSANFSYYPNPVKNMLNLAYTQNITSVAVFNLLGQEVVTRVVNANQSQIDMSNLPTGTYLVKVTADNQVKTIKVIKE